MFFKVFRRTVLKLAPACVKVSKQRGAPRGGVFPVRRFPVVARPGLIRKKVRHELDFTFSRLYTALEVPLSMLFSSME